MDGTRSEPPLQTELEVKIPTDIAVDPLTHIVFWADIDRNRDHIIRYDESTGTYRELDIIGLAEVRGLTVYGDFLYWSDLESSASIAKASKEDGSTRSILFMDYDGVMGLLAVNGSEEAGEYCADDNRRTVRPKVLPLLLCIWSLHEGSERDSRGSYLFNTTSVRTVS